MLVMQLKVNKEIIKQTGKHYVQNSAYSHSAARNLTDALHGTSLRLYFCRISVLLFIEISPGNPMARATATQQQHGP